MQQTGTTLSELFRTVVDGGYCVGCGICASWQDSPVEMAWDAIGRLQPHVVTPPSHAGDSVAMPNVCPFAEKATDEDELARELFAGAAPYHSEIGYSLANYAGFVAAGQFRERGSSGGLTSWILAQLLEHDMVDEILHVHPCEGEETPDRLFKYRASASTEEVCAAAKSRYYPIELSQVLRHVRTHRARYAVVGLPCFIKGIRLLCRHDPVMRERLAVCVGLTCGHLKTRHFADAFAWQGGIKPGDLHAIDFRVKLRDRPASNYAVELRGVRDGKPYRCCQPVTDFYGHSWAYGLFRYGACDYCDDVFAETADVCLGDAWLPQYVHDSDGTNIVIAREERMAELLREGIETGELKLDRLTSSEIAASQRAGLRHRRDGLSYRLHLKDRQGEWHPPKRVRPCARHSAGRKRIYRIRCEIAAQSHRAFREALQASDFSVFKRRMDPLISRHDRLYRPTMVRRAARKGMAMFRALRQSLRPARSPENG